MGRNPSNKEYVTIRIPIKTKEKIAKEASKKGITISEVAGSIVVDEIAKDSRTDKLFKIIKNIEKMLNEVLSNK